MTKKITICVPMYNAATSLRATLDSIIAQDYPISKIKLFNNYSTDETETLIAEFSSKYSNIEVHNSGILISAEENFTRCIQAAEGDFTALLHADDMYEKDFLSSAVKIFEERNDCVAVFCHALEIDQTGKIIGERFLPPEFKKSRFTILSYKDLVQKTLNYANFLTCPSAVVRSDVYREKIKSWNGAEFKTSADLDTWLRASEIGLIAFNSKPLMKYRVADVSFSFRLAKTRTSRHEIFKVLDRCLEKNKDWLTQNSLNDYKFLLFKDDAFRLINAWKNKMKLKEIGTLEEVNWGIVIRRVFRSKWHFKISIGIIFAGVLKVIYE